jgi:predicted ATPase
MYITKLELNNFRSFEHETIELDDITVFVGENNTGKSSIMDAIKGINTAEQSPAPCAFGAIPQQSCVYDKCQAAFFIFFSLFSFSKKRRY